MMSIATLAENFMAVLQVSVLGGEASLASVATELPTEPHSHCQPSCKQYTPQPIQCTLDTAE